MTRSSLATATLALLCSLAGAQSTTSDARSASQGSIEAQETIRRDADSISTVAVMPFTGAAFDSSTLEGFSSALGTKLMGTKRFRVMERAQINAILREQGLQQSGACDGGECAVQMGKLLSVDMLVVGSVAKVGKIHSVSARLVDVESGETRRSSTRNSSTKPETVLTRAIPLLAKDLAGIPAPPDKEIAEEGRYGWIWWAAGGAVVVGGATAAAIILADGNGSPASSPAPSNSEHGETIVVTMP